LRDDIRARGREISLERGIPISEALVIATEEFSSVERLEPHINIPEPKTLEQMKFQATQRALATHTAAGLVPPGSPKGTRGHGGVNLNVEHADLQKEVDAREAVGLEVGDLQARRNEVNARAIQELGMDLPSAAKDLREEIASQKADGVDDEEIELIFGDRMDAVAGFRQELKALTDEGRGSEEDPGPRVRMSAAMEAVIAQQDSINRELGIYSSTARVIRNEANQLIAGGMSREDVEAALQEKYSEAIRRHGRSTVLKKGIAGRVLKDQEHSSETILREKAVRLARIDKNIANGKDVLVNVQRKAQLEDTPNLMDAVSVARVIGALKRDLAVETSMVRTGSSGMARLGLGDPGIPSGGSTVSRPPPSASAINLRSDADSSSVEVIDHRTNKGKALARGIKTPATVFPEGTKPISIKDKSFGVTEKIPSTIVESKKEADDRKKFESKTTPQTAKPGDKFKGFNPTPQKLPRTVSQGTAFMGPLRGEGFVVPNYVKDMQPPSGKLKSPGSKVKRKARTKAKRATPTDMLSAGEDLFKGDS